MLILVFINCLVRYADYGLHTDAVKLVRPKPLPRQENQNLEMVREVLKQPEYRLVDSILGYINVFPFLLQILDPTSPKLGQFILILEACKFHFTFRSYFKKHKRPFAYVERFRSPVTL